MYGGDMQGLPNGCILASSHSRQKPLLAPSLPPSVLREMKHNDRLYPGDTYQYLAFTDGSVYVYPSITRKEMQSCEDYDPRLRYAALRPDEFAKLAELFT